jgi:hypothetical protein
MANMMISSFVYRRIVNNTGLNRWLDKIGAGINKTGIPWATGLTREKAALFVSPNESEKLSAARALLELNSLRAKSALLDYFYCGHFEQRGEQGKEMKTISEMVADEKMPMEVARYGTYLAHLAQGFPLPEGADVSGKFSRQKLVIEVEFKQ